MRAAADSFVPLVRHPRQWMLDALFVWSIVTLIYASMGALQITALWASWTASRL